VCQRFALAGGRFASLAGVTWNCVTRVILSEQSE